MMNPDTNYGLEEAGMAQLDDSVGALLKALDDMGEANNTIVVFSTDNGAETFTWPDGGSTPFRGEKATNFGEAQPVSMQRQVSPVAMSHTRTTPSSAAPRHCSSAASSVSPAARCSASTP